MGNAEQSSRPRRPARRVAEATLAGLVALILLLLTALAAQASYGSVLTQPRRGLSAVTFQPLGQLGLVVAVVVVELGVLAALFYFPWRKLRSDGELPPRPNFRRRSWLALISTPLLLLLVEVVVLLLVLHRRSQARPLPAHGEGLVHQPHLHQAPLTSAVLIPEATALAAVVVLFLVLLALLRRRSIQRWLLRYRPDEEQTPDTEAVLLAALDSGLQEVRAGADLRAAVIRAYQRLERALAARGVGRLPFETALEHMARAARQLALAERPLTVLSRLFEVSRFSVRPISPEMREQAEAALLDLRHQLDPPTST